MFGKVFVLLFFLGAMYLVAQAQLGGECMSCKTLNGTMHSVVLSLFGKNLYR